MKSSEVPLLHQGVLDAAGIDQLLGDIAALGEVLEIQVKQGAQQRADTAPIGLAEARRMLAEGAASALQIRYAFDGEIWVDTLIGTANGARVVRMALPKPPG